MILYSNVFLLLKKKYLREWKLYTEHAFVKKLSNNKLLEDKFLNYLIQDYLFLIQFSKAWSLAIIKSCKKKTEFFKFFHLLLYLSERPCKLKS